MAFQMTSKNIQLQGTVLKADCRKADQTWASSTLDLNSYIGNNNGSFDITGSGFSGSATNITYAGQNLSAGLKAGSKVTTQLLNLNAVIQNIDGVLTFQKLSERIIYSASCLMLQTTTLQGLVMGHDGKLYASSIDLNNYYSNRNASFVSDDKSFAATARNITLDTSSGSVILRAELLNYDKKYQAAEIDIGSCILNRNNQFIFEKHDGPFDRDGFFAHFFERLPVVGFIVAGIQALAGNSDYALQAIAYCTNSTIVCTGIVIGTFVGGVGGAMIGAALTTPIGVLAEHAISTTISDPAIKSQFDELTIGRILYETLRNTLAAGAAGAFGHYLEGVTTSALSSSGKELVAALAKYGGQAVGTASDFTSYAFLKKLSDALIKNQLPPEWTQPNEHVNAIMLAVKTKHLPGGIKSGPMKAPAAGGPKGKGGKGHKADQGGATPAGAGAPAAAPAAEKGHGKGGKGHKADQGSAAPAGGAPAAAPPADKGHGKGGKGHGGKH